MTKKSRTLYLCLILVALSCIFLLIFSLIDQIKTIKIRENLTISTSNISLYVGEEKTNFYYVSNQNAKIEFDYDETIVSITPDRIIGLKAGVTEVTLTATLYDLVETSKFTVSVYDLTYHYVLSPLEDCTFENGTIFCTADSCVFELNIFDSLGNKVLSPNLQFSSDEEIYIDYQYGIICLECKNDCVINIKTDYNYNFDLYFKKMSSLG